MRVRERVRACACACVRACVRACACVCVHHYGCGDIHMNTHLHCGACRNCGDIHRVPALSSIKRYHLSSQKNENLHGNVSFVVLDSYLTIF